MEKKRKKEKEKTVTSYIRAKPVYIATKKAIVKFSEGRYVDLERGKKVDVSKEELAILKRMKFVKLL